MKKLSLLILPLMLMAAAAFGQDKIAKGTVVKILEIAKSDTYYDERAEFLGKSATALGELSKKSDGYYSGTLEVENGRTCFFSSVKVSQSGTAAKTTYDTKSLFTGTIPSGTKFKIVEVPSDDAYYSDKSTIEGKTGVTTSSMDVDKDGYTTGSITTDDGSSYYFYKVRLGKSSGSSSASSSKSTTTSATKSTKYVTGTISVGTSVYVAEISPEDSYYSNKENYVGKRGKVTNSSMTMKSDGYYAGNFTFDDGSTAYFYKAKFSKEPVSGSSSSSAVSKPSSSSSSKVVPKSGDEWDDAENDDDINEGDKVEITAISTEDSYHDNKEDYIGKKGVAGDDLDYDDTEGGYGGTVTLEDGSKPYFYLVKMKKIKSSGSYSKPSSGTASTSSKIAANTRVVVTDIDSNDSFYSSKSTYIGKTGKVAEGLNLQGTDTYSGKILFDDGTDAYFFKVKVTILK